jgi:hypothetical protein
MPVWSRPCSLSLLCGDMITAVHHLLSLFAILYLFLQFAVHITEMYASLLGELPGKATTVWAGHSTEIASVHTRPCYVCKARSPAHNVSVILTSPRWRWHIREAPIHACYSGWVLGLGNSPSMALVIRPVFLNYHPLYCSFSSCPHRPIFRLGEPCIPMVDWLTTSQPIG